MLRPMQKIRGAILIMAALVMALLIGIAAFALDLGRLFVLHTEMQNAVDAAVLSAAAELDGETDSPDAIVRAKTAANQEMLNHLAHFSKQAKLLKDLDDESVSGPGVPDVFTFYSWIGGKYDLTDPPSGCLLDADGRCQTASAYDASYVQIKLDPALLSGGNIDARYDIDLYFLPVLSLFGIDTSTTASTQVVALAGSHQAAVCNYPPMIICDPSEGGPPLIPGENVLLKAHGPGVSWGPGTFGWLIPGHVDDDPYDDGLSGNQLLAHRLGSIYGAECGDPIVEVNPGEKQNWPRWGLNTRFGIYKNMDENETFPSAPNIIDYPRDDLLTDDSGTPCEKSDERFGGGIWTASECNTAPNKQPSTFSKDDFDSAFHGASVPVTTRDEYYRWELEPLNSLAVNTIADADLEADEKNCPDGEGDNCRILNGQPFPSADYVDDDDSDKRRELFVAAVACVEIDIKSNSVININEVEGKWMRFFLTEHIASPSDRVDILAEFIEIVDKRKDDEEHFKKVIQLYD